MHSHQPRWSAGRATVLGVVALLVPAACASEASESGNVTAACDSLEDLATAILDASDAASVVQFAQAVEGPQHAFLESAQASGDDRLADLARTYDREFTTWRTAGGADARQAGNNADVALDRAGARCIELGASNDFPQEPD